MELGSGASDLNYLAPILKDSFEEIAQTASHNLQFLASDEDFRPILRDTQLASLSTTASSPLIVHYPLSDSTGN